MVVTDIAVKDLNPFKKNARTHSDSQVKQIVRSIKEYGFTNPVLTDGKNGIIAGHGRVLAAIEMGLETVPTYPLPHLTKKQIRAYVIADNKLALNAGWDDDLLKEELNAIVDSGIDIDLTGFSLDEIADFLGEPKEPSDTPTEDEPDDTDDDVPVIKENVHDVSQGEMIELGAHQLTCGDCIEVMKSMPDESADSICTDPPAGIAFMGKDWDGDKGGRAGWVSWMTEVMTECHRVLKPGGHGLIWAIPRTSHWTATALEDAGFEIRDIVTHLFGTGFPKSFDVSKAIDKAAGWGTGLKPSSEHWILIRKPMSEKTIADNVLKHGTGGINIGATRIGTDTISTHGSGDKYAGLKTGKSDGVGEYQNHTGRHPANTVFSHHPECKDECHADCPVGMLDESTARFFYCAKPSVSDKGESNNHPTVKSVKLMEYFLKMVTPPGGIVLEPFMGSGTTLIASEKNGFRVHGAEMDPHYCSIIIERWKQFTAVKSNG